MSSESNSKIIKHTFKNLRKGPLKLLTKLALLDVFNPDKVPETTKGYQLERALQYQHRRMMQYQPENIRKLCWQMNCYPAGFYAQPVTQQCQHRVTCPWCFVRRLYDGYKTLTALPEDILQDSQFVAWFRILPWKDDLVFPSPRKGPHQWCQAYVTVQYMFPAYSFQHRNFRFMHVGFQVVPPGVYADVKLYRKAFQPRCFAFKSLTNATPEQKIKAMAGVVRLPWAEMFKKENLEQFAILQNCFPGTHLYRVNKYKPKGP